MQANASPEKKPSSANIDISNIESLKNAQIYKTGYLVKQGGKFKTWKNRYFILAGNICVNDI